LHYFATSFYRTSLHAKKEYGCTVVLTELL
jgi:hypothetical protein